jgi:hypothetical protein
MIIRPSLGGNGCVSREVRSRLTANLTVSVGFSTKVEVMLDARVQSTGFCL